MKRLSITILMLAFSLTLLAQTKPVQKPDSLSVVQIQIDTASLRTFQNLVIENVKGEPTTKQVVTNSIFGILFKNAKMVNIPKQEAIKPKEEKPVKK